MTEVRKPLVLVDPCPRMVAANIVQYGENLFIWFDEAGLPGGVEMSFESAEKALIGYAASLNPDPHAELKRQLASHAQGALHDEGTLEFDDHPEVSIAILEDPGAGLGGYVACWHWVPFDDIGWDRCNNCGLIEERNGDWYDGECPSCADASEPEEDDEGAVESDAYSVENWQAEVINYDTRLGYAEWVTSKREAEEDA